MLSIEDISKQILNAKTKTEWVNDWALGSTGRVMYPYMTTPTNTDPIDSLGRREQSIIFRHRSQHVCLNMHLNKINPMQEYVHYALVHMRLSVNFSLSAQNSFSLGKPISLQILTFVIRFIAITNN